MTSFIAMCVMTIVAFVIARIHRSHKAFVELMFAIMFGYIVGASVKSSYAVTDDNQNAMEQLISNPTLPSQSSTFVGIVDDTTSVMSQETVQKCDTIVPEAGKVPTRNNNTEIEDDS